MIDYPLKLQNREGAALDPDDVDRCFAEAGLQVTLRGSLGKYPGCTHWHLKRGRERGTLEFTLLADGSLAWFSIQGGRTGEWLEEAIAQLRPRLEKMARK